jgi:hypothetical protein
VRLRINLSLQQRLQESIWACDDGGAASLGKASVERRRDTKSDRPVISTGLGASDALLASKQIDSTRLARFNFSAGAATLTARSMDCSTRRATARRTLAGAMRQTAGLLSAHLRSAQPSAPCDG